jgi:hypothetical protein
VSRWTTRDIPDQTGRRVVVTGATSGLGFHTALELARHDATVVLGIRDLDRGREAAEHIRAEARGADVAPSRLDLADLSSVREFAGDVGRDRVDVLVNNAGVMALPPRRSVDGFELQLATNHLGPFALTGLLLPALLSRPGSRVVTVSSYMHRNGRIDLDDLMSDRSYVPGRRTRRPSWPGRAARRTGPGGHEWPGEGRRDGHSALGGVGAADGRGLRRPVHVGCVRPLVLFGLPAPLRAPGSTWGRRPPLRTSRCARTPTARRTRRRIPSARRATRAR